MEDRSRGDNMDTWGQFDFRDFVPETVMEQQDELWKKSAVWS